MWNSLTSLQFVYPEFLWVLGPVSLLLILRWVFQRKKRTYLVFSSSGSAHWSTYLRFFFVPLPYLGFLCLILAAAKPQLVQIQENRQVESVEIVLTVDISESMQTQDFVPNRLEAAKAFAQKFVQSRENDRFSLVVFAGEAYSLCPLTDDHLLIQERLKNLQQEDRNSIGSALGEALAIGINRLRTGIANNRILVLLTDGESDTGLLSSSTSALLAQHFGIRIYPILLGTTNNAALEEVANTTKGIFFSAANAENLNAVLETIDQKETLPSNVEVAKDLSPSFLKGGLVFLLLFFGYRASHWSNVFVD